MKLSQLFADDDAVSTVVAAVLMIAIVVILAGIVASFALGFGDETNDPSPTTQVTMLYVQTDDAETAGFLEVAHNGGDSLPPDRTAIRGSGFRDPSTGTGFDSGEYDVTDADTFASAGYWPPAATTGSDGHVVSEDQVNVGVDSDYDVQVVYESADGQRSSIVTEEKGPDA